MDADTFLKMTAHALAYSDSPIAILSISSYGGTIYIELIEDFKELPGKGVEVYVDHVRICVGNLSMMDEKSITVPERISPWNRLLTFPFWRKNMPGGILFSENLREAAAKVSRIWQGRGKLRNPADRRAPVGGCKNRGRPENSGSIYPDCGSEQKNSTPGNAAKSLRGK
jgi:cation transport ATPase